MQLEFAVVTAIASAMGMRLCVCLRVVPRQVLLELPKRDFDFRVSLPKNVEEGFLAAAHEKRWLLLAHYRSIDSLSHNVLDPGRSGPKVICDLMDELHHMPRIGVR